MLEDAALGNIGKNIWPSELVEVLLQSRVDGTVQRTRKRKINIVTTCENDARRKNCDECV
jgi:hypothetical protein